MSLRPKMAHVALSNLEVLGPYQGDMLKEPGEGGWHSLFEGSYPLPNYRPAFPLSALEFYLYRLVFLGDTDHRPLKPYFLNAKSYTKVT